MYNVKEFSKCDTCDHAKKSGNRTNSVKGVMYGCERGLELPCGHYELSRTVKSSIFTKKIKCLFPDSPEGKLWFHVFALAASDSTGKNSTFGERMSGLRFLREGFPDDNLLDIDMSYVRSIYVKCGLKL